MTDQIVSTLQQSLRGRLIGPSDADYDAARALYNGMIDKRPRLIARCVDVADVIAAVNFGRDQGLLVAIRGGGHSGPGLGSCNDGLVVDLSMMKSVRVDPASRTVRVDAGCTSGDVDHATHAFGLAVPFGIVSTTGVAGLTVGGGTGYLTASTASRLITCSKRTLCWPTAVLSRPAKASTPISSGRCAGEVATLAW
jgi:FAD/FMN-containing dehydrogenases